MNVIEIEDLWKEYRLGTIGHGTLTQDLQSWWAKVRGKDDPNSRVGLQSATHSKQIDGNRFWALQGINLQVKSGEVIGIIGKNGAGKSTMLKILSRVTGPTRGIVKVRGRISSLLEVGTGFHRELSGRENVFLNGAILGMSKKEVKKKFDEIVDFSGIEAFIDTPVKRYSSGMYVRLAFAVAAHLEPEILIIDEVLAVGDADFQKKCLGKMGKVAHEGRTVLFVSHNMGMINQLCPSSVWLSGGRIKNYGTTKKIIDEYLSQSLVRITGGTTRIPKDIKKASQLISFNTLDDAKNERELFDCDQQITLSLLYSVNHKIKGLYGYMQIMTAEQKVVLVSDSFDSGQNTLDDLAPGEHQIIIKIPPRTLAHGTYYVYFNFTGPESQGEHIDCPGIVGLFHLSDVATKRGDRRGGFFSTILGWEVDGVN